MMKTYLITGAGRGIGRATAVALAGPKTQLILTSRTLKELEETDDMVRAKGGQALLIQHDLRNFPGIQEMARSLGQRFTEGLDGLVLNGGTLGRLQSVEDMDPVHFGEVMETNLIANFIFLKAFASMLRKAGGHVMALTTGAVPNPRAYWGAYAASKAGLESLTLAFDREVGEAVRVNLFDPGRVRTDMRATAYPGEDRMSVRAAEEVGQVIADLLTDPELGSGQRFHANDYPSA